MASIVRKKLSSGEPAYLVRYRTLDGKQRSKQFGRRRDAESFKARIQAERHEGTLVDPHHGRLTVDEWWQIWWPTVTNLRPSTRARDEIYYRLHILPNFGSTPLARLDRTSLRRWVARLLDANGSDLAPATVRKIAHILNKLVRAALEDRLISSNPVDRLPLPPASSAARCVSPPPKSSTAWPRPSTPGIGHSCSSAGTGVFASARCSACGGAGSTCFTAESRWSRRWSTSTTASPSIHRRRERADGSSRCPAWCATSSPAAAGPPNLAASCPRTPSRSEHRCSEAASGLPP
ncbi:MAG: hypothetical protein R2755_33160 [Acidimicrobiales bacterium]